MKSDARFCRVTDELAVKIRYLARKRLEKLSVCTDLSLGSLMNHEGLSPIDRAFLLALYRRKLLRASIYELCCKLLKITDVANYIDDALAVLNRELAIYAPDNIGDTLSNSLRYGDAYYPLSTQKLHGMIGRAIDLLKHREFIDAIKSGDRDIMLRFIRNPDPDLPPLLGLLGDDYGNSTIPSAVCCFLALAAAAIGRDLLNTSWYLTLHRMPEDIESDFDIHEPLLFCDYCPLMQCSLVPNDDAVAKITDSIFYVASEKSLIMPCGSYIFGSQYHNFHREKIVGDLRKTVQYGQDCASFVVSTQSLRCQVLQYDYFNTSDCFILRQLVLDYYDSNNVSCLVIGSDFRSAAARLLNALTPNCTIEAELATALMPFPKFSAWIGSMSRELICEIVSVHTLSALLSICEKIFMFDCACSHEAIEFAKEHQHSLVVLSKAVPEQFGKQSGGHIGVMESVVDYHDGRAAVIYLAASRSIEWSSHLKYNEGHDSIAYDVAIQDKANGGTWLMALRRSFE